MAAITNNQWYVNWGNGSSTGYYAIAKWATGTSYTVGQIVRPATAPSAANERAYICIIAGLSVTEPTWTFTKGAINAGTVESFQECTGQAAVNGDNSAPVTGGNPGVPIWVASSTVSLGMIVMNTGRTGFFIASAISGSGTTAGSQPAGLTTPVLGATTVDNSGANQVTWTCIKATGTAFSLWGAPFSWSANALVANWGKAGDDFFISSAHAETQGAALTLTFPGTAVNPNRLLCTDTSASPPVAGDLTTGASITTTGSFALTQAGYCYTYGVTFSCGTGANALNLTIGLGEFESCTFALPTTSTSSMFFSLTTPGYTDLNNCTFTFGAAGSKIQNRGGWLRIRGSSTSIAATGTVPTVPFAGIVASVSSVTDVDLSVFGNKTLFATLNISTRNILRNCRLGASAVIIAGGAGGAPQGYCTDVIVCDNGATGYRQERYWYEGTLTTSTSVYNNASDGVTPISWQVITTANSKRYTPFECFEIVQWVAAGTYAATVLQCTSASAGLTNADIWVEAEYLGNASYPLASLATSGPATQLTVGSSLAAGSWVVGGLGNNYQLALPSFTTNLAGYVRFTVKVAKPSLTINIDPAVTVA